MSPAQGEGQMGHCARLWDSDGRGYRSAFGTRPRRSRPETRSGLPRQRAATRAGEGALRPSRPCVLLCVLEVLPGSKKNVAARSCRPLTRPV